jgi:hypothetical protein
MICFFPFLIGPGSIIDALDGLFSYFINQARPESGFFTVRLGIFVLWKMFLKKIEFLIIYK